MVQNKDLGNVLKFLQGQLFVQGDHAQEGSKQFLDVKPH